MTAYNIVKDLNLTMTMSVEASSREEAIEKVNEAWSNNEEFVHNYLYQADIADAYTYDVPNANGAVPFDELL